MKITCLTHSPTKAEYLRKGLSIYNGRITKYVPFDWQIIPDLKNTKNLSIEVIKQKEGQLLLKQLHPQAYLVLLDEKGKSYTSQAFSKLLQSFMLANRKYVTFAIGGAYGFSEEVYQRANHKMRLSDMTFSHQMIRLLFVEQLYRAYTILNNEPYHHQ